MKDEKFVDDADIEATHLLPRDTWEQRPHSRIFSPTWVLGSLLLAATAAIVYLSVQVSVAPPPSAFGQENFGDCGSTPLEARANGCKFDVTIWAWERPACYDQELIDDFLTRADWRFYRNWTFEAADELPLERVLAGDYETSWVGNEYHPLHCTYMWRKMHRHILGLFALDHVTIPWEHTEHCERILLGTDVPEMDCSVFPHCTTKLDAIYAKCGHT